MQESARTIRAASFPVGEGPFMQMFIAETSKNIDRAGFERFWQISSTTNPAFKVAFGFAGNRISAKVESSNENRWQSDDFHRAFSSVVRLVDQSCNIRWI